MNGEDDDDAELEEDELALAWRNDTATARAPTANADWARGRFTGWKLRDTHIPLKVEPCEVQCPLVVCVDVAFYRHVLASKEEPSEETHVHLLCLGSARGAGSVAARVCKLVRDSSTATAKVAIPIDIFLRDGQVFAVYSRGHSGTDIAAALRSSAALSVEARDAVEAAGAIARSLSGVRQTVFEAGKGNALQACVATCFRLDLSSVPDFVAEAGAACESPLARGDCFSFSALLTKRSINAHPPLTPPRNCLSSLRACRTLDGTAISEWLVAFGAAPFSAAKNGDLSAHARKWRKVKLLSSAESTGKVGGQGGRDGGKGEDIASRVLRCILPEGEALGALCIVRGTSPRGAHGHVVVGRVVSAGIGGEGGIGAATATAAATTLSRDIELAFDPFPPGRGPSPTEKGEGGREEGGEMLRPPYVWAGFFS